MATILPQIIKGPFGGPDSTTRDIVATIIKNAMVRRNQQQQNASNAELSRILGGQRPPADAVRALLASPKLDVQTKAQLSPILANMGLSKAKEKNTPLEHWVPTKDGYRYRRLMVPESRYNSIQQQLESAGAVFEQPDVVKKGGKNPYDTIAISRDDGQTWEPYYVNRGKDGNREVAALKKQGYRVRKNAPKSSSSYLNDKSKLIDDTNTHYQTKANMLRDPATGMISDRAAYNQILEDLESDKRRIARGDQPKFLMTLPPFPTYNAAHKDTPQPQEYKNVLRKQGITANDLGNMGKSRMTLPPGFVLDN